MQRASAHAHHLGQHIPLGRAVVGYTDGPADVSHAELRENLRQGQELLAGGDVAGQPAPVLGPVFQVLVGGQTESAGLHRLVENLLHLVQFALGDRGALTGRDHTQNVAAQRREGNETADVYSEALLVETVHVFGEGLPVQRIPWRMDSNGMASMRFIIRIFRSRSSGRVGAKPKPHCPTVSEVTPNWPDREA